MAGALPDQLIRNVQRGNSSLHLYVWRNPLTNQAFDPTSLHIKVKDGTDSEESETTYVYGVDDQIVRTGTGAFTFTCPHPTTGTWRVRAEAVSTTLGITVVKTGHVLVIDAYA